MIRFRRISIPYQAAYVAFFVASLITMLTLFRLSGATAAYVFALLVITVAVIVSVHEAFRTLRRL